MYHFHTVELDLLAHTYSMYDMATHTQLVIGSGLLLDPYKMNVI